MFTFLSLICAAFTAVKTAADLRVSVLSVPELCLLPYNYNAKQLQNILQVEKKIAALV